NCARGGVVDPGALSNALRDGRIAGAGIDVFDPEPPNDPDPLYAFENVIVTPHIAGLSHETNRRLSLSAAEQVLQVLADERPPRLVNPEVWDRRRRGSPGRPRSRRTAGLRGTERACRDDQAVECEGAHGLPLTAGGKRAAIPPPRASCARCSSPRPRRATR